MTILMNHTPPPKTPRILVGLGNPGPEYAHTFHNIGSLFLDSLTETMVDSPQDWKDTNSFSYLRTPHTFFVKPHVFMNESGKAVSAALRYFSLSPRDLFVAHDDADIALGDFKISFGKSAGGHRGVQSIIDALDTSSFSRIRIGVRAPSSLFGIPLPRRRAGDLVLKKISTAHMRVFRDTFSTLMHTLYD